MYIVIRQHGDGRLIGSTLPFKHTSLKKAQEECKRLASMLPNNTFYPMKSLKGFTNRPVETKYANVFN